jgi:hypothetical protein
VRGGLGAAILLALAPAGAALAQGAPLVGLNDREAKAEAVWALRAGLNVAALQCQFSPFLMTVPTYNALLRQHSDEMAAAFKTMTGYFLRTIKGTRAGERAFDTYATRTNQSWATFDAQYEFCDAAAMVGRRALFVPKGDFARFAAVELPALRASLARPVGTDVLKPRLEWAATPQLANCRPGRACL